VGRYIGGFDNPAQRHSTPDYVIPVQSVRKAGWVTPESISTKTEQDRTVMDISSAFKTADLCDEFAGELEVCLVQFRTFGGRKSFSGEIQTVSTYEDVALVRQCLEQPGQGRVLVVDGGGSTRSALLGDRLSTKAIENGWAGILVFGAVRDTEALATMNLGVMALGVVPARGTFNGTGVIGASFQVGGVEFAPGRFIYCDMDGVVVSARRLHELM
jgi:regulator of ribonuclease activity A